MNKLIGFLIVIALVVGAGFLFLRDRAGTTDETPEMNVSIDSIDSTPVNVGGNTETPAQNVRSFAIESSPFKFAPNALTVKKGDTVRITLINTEGTHDLKIDEFNAATKVLSGADEEDTITFVADKVGTFEYYCSIGNHRAMGMVGKLTVTE